MTTEELNAIIAKAEAGDVASMNQLGHVFGQEEYKNLEKAFYWHKRAAESGNVNSMANLGGWCYLYGNGVEKDVDKAIHWLTRAAEEGNHIWSMNKLTYIYGELDGYINQELAAKWFLELIKRDCDPNSGVYENTGYNKERYEIIKNVVLNSTTEDEMMSSMSGGNGGSLLGGAMSFTTSNAKSYINQAEEAIQRNIKYKEEQRRKAAEEEARRRAEEEAIRKAEEDKRKEAEDRAVLIKQIETDYKDSLKSPVRSTNSTFEIPNGTQRIGDHALDLCRNAHFIFIPDTVTSIGKQAFRGLTSLESVAIPNSVTSRGKYAFSECKSLTSIEVPSALTSIEEATFSLMGINEIRIPNGVTHIGNWAFMGCQNLKIIEFPNNLISLGDNTMDGCYGLETIIVPKDKKEMILEKLEEADLMKIPKIVEK